MSEKSPATENPWQQLRQLTPARIALGRAGVFDTTGFSDAALMVFNSTLPAEPGTCNGVGYTIEIEASTGRMAAPAYRFDAPHFLQPGVSEAADSDETAAP